MKRLLLLIFLVAFFASISQNSFAQSDPDIPSATDDEFDLAGEYTSPNKGEYFDYTYDPCTGILKYVFYVYETGETDEVRRMTLWLKDEHESDSDKEMIFNWYLRPNGDDVAYLNGTGFGQVNLSLATTTITSWYETIDNLLNVKERTRGEDVFVQLDFFVGPDYDFKKTYINMEVGLLGSDGFDEYSTSTITDQDKSSFTTDKVKAPGTAPTISRLSDQIGFNLNFLLPTNCSGGSGGNGSFYEIERTWADGSNSTMIQQDIPYSFGAQSINDTDNVDQCIEYKYRIRVYTKVDGTRKHSAESQFSSSLQYTELLAEPSNIAATTDLCDGTVKVSWTYNLANPTGFVVYRKKQGESVFTALETVAGGVREFSDAVPEAERNIDREYRIATKNVCGETPQGSLSSVTGRAPEALIAPTDVQVAELISGSSRGVRITWNDNSAVEDKYIISRQFKNGGGLVNIELSANTTSYDDFDVTICQQYVYTVKVVDNSCAPDGFFDEDESKEISLDADLTDIVTENSLIASRGYFADRVTLDWTVGGLSDNISRYRIFSRPLGSSDEPVLIGVVNGSERTYEDSKAEPGLVLEYFLIGETDCGDDLLRTNNTQQIALSTSGVSKATGFRSPTGVINGNIAYSGGNGVQGVKVIVETDDGNNGRSLLFDGNDAITIADSDAELSPEKLSIGFYIKPTLDNLPNEGSLLFEKSDALKVTIAQDGKISLSLFINGSFQTLESANGLTSVDFQQVYLTYDGTAMKIYFNGVLDNTKAQTGSIDANNSQAIVVGQSYHGLLDEISFWNISKSQNAITSDYVRLLNRDETGLIGYWPIDVGLGDEVFDASKNGNKFNGNDGKLVGTTWSTSIPDKQQLGTIAYTNAQGNYTVSGIPFNGEGQNFEVTPIFGVHEFSPQQKFIYIGSGNLVQNGVDFEDVSSFTVSGSVVFDYNGVKTGSQGAKLLVDGQPLFDSNGKIIVTDADGLFSIQVPIGDHYITVEKDNHTFDFDGRFPTNPTERFNFNEPVSGLEFIDNTRRKLVGKIVGGTREGNKPVGFDRTVNNIGKARFALVSSNELVTADITTDLETGEFEIDLPPLLYNFKQPITEDIGKALKVTENTTLTLPTSQIDLSTNYDPGYDTDTVVIAENVPLKAGTVRIDTVDNNTREVRRFNYDYKLNQIIRTVPQVEVFDGAIQEDKTFKGITEFPIKVDDQINAIPLHDESGNLILDYPVIMTDSDYKLRIKVSEKYTNQDSGNPVEDLVPVTDAEITIDNNMMEAFYLNSERRPVLYSQALTKPKIQLRTTDGDTTITFKALTPEFNSNADPSLNYTKSFKVTVLAGGNVVNWPNPNDQNEVQRIYVLGSGESENSSFVTAGPETVDHIIRDPYGGESYAYLEKGATLTVTKSFSFTQDDEVSVEGGVRFGKSDGTNAGVSAGFEYSTSLDSAGTSTTELTTTESFQTREDAQEVGAGADLFISSALNYESGYAKTLRFVEVGTCNSGGIISCLENSPKIQRDGKEYQLALTVASFLEPAGNPTYFIYTQNHIVNTLIPDLKNARNSVLALDDRYESKIPDTDPNYGLRNDDVAWNLANNDPVVYSFVEDADGPSYKFTPKSTTDSDTLAWINQQIRLWQDAVKRNEIEKAAALQSNDFENYSITGGATFSKEISSSKSESYELTYSTSSAFSVGVSVDLEFLGGAFGVNFSTNATFTESRSSSYSSERVESTTYGFVLSEPDVGDFSSMNVYPGVNGNGPIFLLTGGETSCPHEEAVTTLFYEPGTVIGKSTFQRDKPRLEAPVSEIYNVPADRSAAFNVTLYNDSESGDDFLYALQIIDESNPDGAVVRMDGEFFDSRRQIFVPGGSAINKTITIDRGPFEYDYENIKVVMASICQSDPTDFDRNIADTVSISAFFLPICTTPEIISPDNNWTINNRFNNEMTVEIGDFDINFPGFEYLELQYKSSETSAWIPIQKFYRDLQASGNPANGIQIPRTGSSFAYKWEVSKVLDGNYDLRVISDCEVLSTGGRINAESSIKSGIIDRINPHLFGSAQPADGILSPGDEISVQFNEPINTALLSPSNFMIRGVLNGGDIDHNVSLSFDGSGDECVTIPNPPNMAYRDFTIDFWAKRNATGQEVIIHQGASLSQMMQVGFDDNDKLYFEMNGNRFTSTLSITDQQWTHYTLSYDYTNAKVHITLASAATTQTDEVENFDEDYTVGEPLIIGKSTVGEVRPFNGQLHQLRIWGKIPSETEIAVNRNIKLTASTNALLADWPFDEGVGNVSLDIVKVRRARIQASWKLDPSGNSMSFDGTDDYLESNGIGSFNETQSFTIEMWFKTTSSAAGTLFSNGKGDGADDNANGWSVDLVEGNLVINNNGESIATSGLELADGVWHHMALVVNRTTNLGIIVDGELRKSVSSEGLSGFSNDLFWYGRRAWKTGGSLQFDQHWNGNLDEFRLWNNTRTLEQIRFNRYNNLNGDELGLVLYYPFEAYVKQAGILVSEQSLKSGVMPVTGGSDVTSHADFSTAAPSIRLPRPLQAVNFNYSANDDKIILTTNEDNARIENVILNIGVKNIKDINGNALSAPLTWTAFVDRNDVVWLDDELSFSKPVDEPFSFTTEIVNSGGQLRDFEISNLPFWLSASPSSGQIEPAKSEEIRFTVNEGLNIGAYNEFIHLTTDFGFDEKLELELKVFKAPPTDWVVNPADFQSSMSVVAQIKINDIFSRDGDDLIAAFVDGEVRGIGRLERVEAFDNYQAFMSIYTDVNESQDIVYKIWDASEGKIYTGVQASVANVGQLTPDAHFGKPAAPVIFSASAFIEQNLQISEGWQWISFNLSSDDLSDVNSVFSNYTAKENDQIKGVDFFDQYDPVNGWIGTLSANGGLKNDRMYKVNASGTGSVAYSGSLIDAQATPIALSQGWNWIGFYGQQNHDINEALTNITNLTVGDRIKGQREFAVYGGQGVGWVGSLENLIPGQGYLFFTQTAGTLTYPEFSRRVGGEDQAIINSGEGNFNLSDFGIHPRGYEHNMNFIIEVLESPSLSAETYIVVKSKGQNVGLGRFLEVDEKGLFFTTIYGNNPDELSFDLMIDGQLTQLEPASGKHLKFQKDVNAGSLQSPEEFVLGEELALAKEISVRTSPNPFVDGFSLSWSSGAPPDEVRMVRSDGSILLVESEVRGDQIYIDAGHLPGGLYIVRLQFDNQIKTVKVIKSR